MIHNWSECYVLAKLPVLLGVLTLECSDTPMISLKSLKAQKKRSEASMIYCLKRINHWLTQHVLVVSVKYHFPVEIIYKLCWIKKRHMKSSVRTWWRQNLHDKTPPRVSSSAKFICCQHAETSAESPSVWDHWVTNTQAWITVQDRCSKPRRHKLICCSHAILPALLACPRLTQHSPNGSHMSHIRLDTNQTYNQSTQWNHLWFAPVVKWFFYLAMETFLCISF